MVTANGSTPGRSRPPPSSGRPALMSSSWYTAPFTVDVDDPGYEVVIVARDCQGQGADRVVTLKGPRIGEVLGAATALAVDDGTGPARIRGTGILSRGPKRRSVCRCSRPPWCWQWPAPTARSARGSRRRASRSTARRRSDPPLTSAAGRSPKRCHVTSALRLDANEGPHPTASGKPHR
jgi:hypothetical protein